MSIRKITREDSDFYSVMGPVFGSRDIERASHDRFYDDPGKIWYVSENAVASTLHHTIRNFYAKNIVSALPLIKGMMAEHGKLVGIVPRKHLEAFRECGFFVKEHSKNFIEVSYEAD